MRLKDERQSLLKTQKKASISLISWKIPENSQIGKKAAKPNSHH
jgi:hypothetical protein